MLQLLSQLFQVIDGVAFLLIRLFSSLLPIYQELSDLPTKMIAGAVRVSPIVITIGIIVVKGLNSFLKRR